MNILPKKRWHVRTKENIAKVRRDEAQAAEEAKEKERRIKLAEKEARTELLRLKSRARFSQNELCEASSSVTVKSDTPCNTSKSGHVNFFADEEAGISSSTAVNQEHEEEKKQEQEKYEKQIGYLTYLGQDTNEATGKVSWYNKSPERIEPGLVPKEELGLKHKILSDPLNSFRKFVFKSTKKSNSTSAPSIQPSLSIKSESSPQKRKSGDQSPPESTQHKKRKKNKKEKKHKHSSSHKKRSKVSSYVETESDSESSQNDMGSKDDNYEQEKHKNLEKLRAERLKREREEKKKAEKLLAKVNGVAYIDEEDQAKLVAPMKQKYNSQFNPYLAKQNFDDQRYRFAD